MLPFFTTTGFLLDPKFIKQEIGSFKAWAQHPHTAERITETVYLQLLYPFLLKDTWGPQRMADFRGQVE